MNLPRIAIVVMIIAVVLCSSYSLAQTSKMEKPNDMSIELLGRNILYSLTYQRLIVPNFGLEFGLSMIGGSEGGVAFISGGGRLYLLEGDASPCLAGGLVAVTGTTDSGPFESDNSAVYGYIGPGFEYRSSGGILLRGTIYFLVHEGFLVWPGVQVGIAF